LSVATVSPNK